MNQRGGTRQMQIMLDHSREAVAVCSGIQRADLDRDRKLNLALVQLLVIVGGAAGRVSRDQTGRHPAVAWGEFVSLREHLVHEYDKIDLDEIWRVLTADLPPLVRSLERILEFET